jgi:hypothetical protein
VTTFDGSTFIPEFDENRLNAQEFRVYDTMSDGAWRTLSEIQKAGAARAGYIDPEASISARLRGLRKAGCTVERRRRGDPRAGLWEYRVLVPAGAAL